MSLRSRWLVWGFHPVREALRERPRELQRVLIAASRGGARRAEIMALCAAQRVSVEVMQDEELDRHAGGVHNGFLAEIVGAPARPAVLAAAIGAARPPASPAKQARSPEAAAPAASETAGSPTGSEVASGRPAAEAAPSDEPARFDRPAKTEPTPAAARRPRLAGEVLVLVEDVQDPRNLGALLRVCEGAGVARVLVRDRGSAPITATVAKTSAGAIAHLDVERVTNSAQEIERAKRDGYWVYALEASGKPPWELDLGGKVMLCVGGEEKGLRERTKSLCDGVIGLPMLGKVESLNLSTAAAAVLYDVVRQRTAKRG